MARPFTWPAIPALEVGESAVIEAAPREVERKVNAYANRKNARTVFEGLEPGVQFAFVPVPAGTHVTRLS